MIQITQLNVANIADIEALSQIDSQVIAPLIGLKKYAEYREHCFVAYEDEKLVGFIYGGVLCKTLYPQYLYVIPSYRNNGLGKELLNTLENNTDCTASMVYYNRSLCDFYQKIGYHTGEELCVSLKMIGEIEE